MMKKKIWWVGGGVAATLVVAGAVAFMTGMLPGMPGQAQQGAQAASANKKGKDGDKPVVPLEFTAQEVVRPQMARLPAVIAFSGPLVAPQTAVLRARVGGTLLTLAVSEGSRVRAGQVLGRIDLAEASSRVAERRAMVESARTALAQAERTHTSNERLAQQQFISGIALDNSRAAVETAQAALNAARAALDTQQVMLRDGSLAAPISGIVAKRHALPGEKIGAQQELLTIVDISRLELAGSVGTHEVSRLKAGLPVQVQVEGLVQPVAGRIARIAPAAEPGTRSIAVTIELPNANETLRAGQYALARATLADDTERLTLPMSAVGSTAGQDHVWLIENGVLARRAVTLGRRDDSTGRVEVLQGLQADNQVLGARFDNLREGQQASVQRGDSGERSGGVAAVASAASAATTLMK
jgi:membrane fusion protein, multidrug efflux system